MSVNDSNLSLRGNNSDLVVAVSQAAINAQLMWYLDNLAPGQATTYFFYDTPSPGRNSGPRRVIAGGYEELKRLGRTDPFAITDPRDPDSSTQLDGLLDARFAAAMRVTFGTSVDYLKSPHPPLLTLGPRGKPAFFNLLCTEVVMTGFLSVRFGREWINRSARPRNTPWIYGSQVDLRTEVVRPGDPLPKTVKDALAPLPGVFTAQKLFLDFSTALLQTVPNFVESEDDWELSGLIQEVFPNECFETFKRHGNPALGYTITRTDAQPSALQLCSISRDCQYNSEHSEASSVLYYGSRSTTPPAPPDSWDWEWIEAEEIGQMSGVLAVRRDVFFDYLIAILNQMVRSLCLDTFIHFSYDSAAMEFDIKYGYAISAHPPVFTAVQDTPDERGYIKLFELAHDSSAHNHCQAFADIACVSGDFDYHLRGSVSVSKEAIELSLRAWSEMSFGHGETALAHYTDLERDRYYDKTMTVQYKLAVNQDGGVEVVEPKKSERDDSVEFKFSKKGIMGLGMEDLRKSLKGLDVTLGNAVDVFLGIFPRRLEKAISSYNQWVFPGTDSFVFTNVRLSEGRDLVASLTYTSPELTDSLSRMF